MTVDEGIWVFCGVKWQFPSGLFTDLAQAEAWIAQYSLTGILTKYPVNEGVYNWAVRNGFFKPSPNQETSVFVSRFTSASQDHHHYENGMRQT